MSDKDRCKQTISMALWAAEKMPWMFGDGRLFDSVCREYGSEYVASCMLEMGYGKER